MILTLARAPRASSELRDVEADIAAAGDDDAVRLRLLVAEDAERAADLACLADDIDEVADQHRVR